MVRHKSKSSKPIEKPEVDPIHLKVNPELDNQNEVNEAQKDPNDEVGNEINKRQIETAKENLNTKDLRKVHPSTAQTPNKPFSTRLTNLFVKINDTFSQINKRVDHAKELVLEAYNLAIQENYTPQEAKQLLLDNITEFKKTQIYAYLPSESKNPVKQRARLVSHNTEVSVPAPEQNVEQGGTDSVSHSISHEAESDNYLIKLQAENIFPNKEIEEDLMKKDRLIEELQMEKDELIQFYENRIQQINSEIPKNHSDQYNEPNSNDPEAQYTKKPVPELTKKILPKVYYKELPLVEDITLPLQVHINPENDECFLEIDNEVVREVFGRVCKELD